MTISGLEVALFRASLKEDVSEYARWGRSTARLETDITIPFLDDEGLLVRWIDSAIGRGFPLQAQSDRRFRTGPGYLGARLSGIEGKGAWVQAAP